jgi:L-threonylcarbamoyladenylate synthase
VTRAVAALRAGQSVVLPTDTVYGLACDPRDEDAVRRMYALKGRAAVQPTAVVAASVDALLDLVPELADHADALHALLPGALTLVLPNPARRFGWLAGDRPDTIGARVPEVAGAARHVLDAVGAVAATSANLPGGPDPRRLADVPAELLAGTVAVDGGELPGVPSTVIDLTRDEPVVLREGAVPASVVLRRLDR